MTDRELLAGYARDGDPGAFAEIVRRHAAKVYSACLRQLGNHHEAEDAAQAAFLVLARKARGLSSRTALSGWLLVTARHAARDLAKSRARRARREREAAAMRSRENVDRLWEQARPEMDALLLALPARQRDALALCYLDGRSRVEAARELGCSEKALDRRVTRGLARLRERLGRKGAHMSAAALAALLGGKMVGAAPAGLTDSLLAVGSGGGAGASPAALSAAKGAMNAMMWTKIKIAAAVLAAASVVGGGGALTVTKLAAAEPKVKKAGEVLPVLKPDPKVLAILKGLGENQSAWLPAVSTAGEMNAEVRKFKLDKSGPRPRDYCLKWVWAADRKRALFCGGNAGVPHKLNDVWEYDLASNTWVLLWSPDPDTNRVRHMKKPGEAKAYLDKFVKLDAVSGEIMTRRGAPFDPVHTWWALTYDPEMKALLWIQGNHHLHGLFMKEHPELKARYKLGGYHKMRLFAYYPHLNKWEFMKYPAGLHKSPAAILDYIPELGGSLYYTSTHAQQGMFGSKTKKWEFKKLAGSHTRLRKERPECPPSEAVSAYDSASKLLVVHHGGGTHRGKPVPKKTYHYDVKANKWSKVLESKDGPLGYDNRTPMVYDSVAKACLIVEPNALWSYRVGDKKWTELTPKGPALKSRRVFMACYNPEHNVLMADNGGGKVWVYRAKKAAKRGK